MLKGQRSGSRPLRSSLGSPTRRPMTSPARDRCQRQEASTASLIPSAMASLEGTPRSRLRGDPLEIRGHQTSPVFRSALGRLRPAPAGAEPGERGRLCRLTGLRLPTKPASWGTPLPVGVEIGLEGPDRPVGGGAAAVPLPPGALPRPRGGVQGEPGRRQRPAVGDGAPPHQLSPGGPPPAASPGPPARPPPPRPRAWRTGLDARPRSAGSCSRARNLRPPPFSADPISVSIRPTVGPSRAAHAAIRATCRSGSGRRSAADPRAGRAVLPAGGR